MTMEGNGKGFKDEAVTVLFWGALWGIFEATVGYALHLIPLKIGSYIWFPAAYFFMDRVFATTGKYRAVAGVAFLSAGIKLLNLFSPMRVDYVINPAVSILLEAVAMVCALCLIKAKQENPLPMIGKVFVTNVVWRLLYTLYAAFVIPDWMRQVSVISGKEVYMAFMVMENLISTAVCAAWLGSYGLLRNKGHKRRFSHERVVWYAGTGVLLGVSCLVQFLL